MGRGVHVGVDGGATRARAVVISHDGDELARSSGAAALVDPLDPAAAAAVVARLVQDALDAVPVRGPAAGLCCGLAGAGGSSERDAVRAMLMRSGLAEAVTVTSDAEVAMADAFGTGPGVLVIAGTGSIAWGRTAAGEAVRVGGRGALLDDSGSGYALGLGALRAAVLAADGRRGPTLLTKAVLRATGCDDVDTLVSWSAAADKRTIAALATVLLQCAERGDPAAFELRQDAVTAIVGLAVHAVSRARLLQPAVALAGGLIEPGGPLRGDVSDTIRSGIQGVTILGRAVDAASGAARMSLALAVETAG